MRGDQARVLLSRAEHLPATPRLLADPDLGGIVADAVDGAERIHQALHEALRTLGQNSLAANGRDPDPNALDRLVRSLGADREYWAHLGGAFERNVDGIARKPDRADDERRGFADQCKATARRVLVAAGGGLGTGRASCARLLWPSAA